MVDERQTADDEVLNLKALEQFEHVLEISDRIHRSGLFRGGELARGNNQINVSPDRHESGEPLLRGLALPKLEIPCFGIFK